MAKPTSTVILPPFAPAPRTFTALAEAVERRVAMARALDPEWGGLPKPFLDTNTPLDAILVLASFGLVPIALGALAFSRGPVTLAIALAAAASVLFAWRACRRAARYAREWRSRAIALPASLVTAEEILFDAEKKEDAYGFVVVAFDPPAARSVLRLIRVGKAVMWLREEPQESLPSHWLPLHSYMKAVTATGEWHAVPFEIAGADNVYATALEFHRDRLPRGQIDRRTFFCLVDPERSPEGIELLPAEWWWTPETDPFTSFDPTDERGGGASDEGELSLETEAAPAPPAPPPARETEPVVFLPLVGRAGYLARVAIASAFAVATIAPLLLKPASARSPALAGFALAAALLVAWAIRSRRSRFLADDAGLERRTAFGEKRLGWDEIDCFRMGALSNRVTGRSRRKGGRRVAFSIGGSDLALRHIVDAIIERAPALAAVGWAAGLAKAAPPRGDDARFPRAARRLYDDIVIEGPGDNRVVFDSKHPDLESIERSISERLSPLLLREATRRAPAPRGAR